MCNYTTDCLFDQARRAHGHISLIARACPTKGSRAKHSSMKQIWLTAAIALVSGCADPPDRTTPSGAFARLAPCVDAVSARCLFNELDRDSRWSAHTIHRTLTESLQLVRRSFPESRHRSMMGRWYDKSTTADGAHLFEQMCRDQQCLAQLAQGFGAVVDVRSTSATTAVVKTTRGALFEMAAADGKWGFADHREALQQAKIRVLDRLAQLKQNAAELENMKRAGTDLAGATDRPPVQRGKQK